MNVRMVKCRKFNAELPGLAKPPFSGDVGKKIFETVSQKAWDDWLAMQIKIINEYRLNLGNKQDYDRLIEQMMAFLALKDGAVVEVENAERGRSGS